MDGLQTWVINLDRAPERLARIRFQLQALALPFTRLPAVDARALTPAQHAALDEAAYRRMFQMYAAGLAHATDPFEVGKLIHHAVTTDHPQLRYAVSWGAKEMIDGRAAMTDEQWTAIGLAADDNAYYDAFQAAFGLDLRDLG